MYCKINYKIKLNFIILFFYCNTDRIDIFTKIESTYAFIYV
jgi:hypothetical protein